MNSPHKGQWRGALMCFFDLRPNKRLSKQSWSRWFETPSRSLWRHYNVLPPCQNDRSVTSGLPSQRVNNTVLWYSFVVSLTNCFTNSRLVFDLKRHLTLLWWIWYIHRAPSGLGSSLLINGLYYGWNNNSATLTRGADWADRELMTLYISSWLCLTAEVLNLKAEF